ncbi:MAG: DUF4190 domain-containing protein [Winogradskyella sp.]|uniref:CCC motif membrane protein n=1 Tax=Winogradskyella sp. TaxID=1883156 RepID=UPI0025DA6AFB|nr:CCC motif membrane protein [Winogradskyella sp.]NRB60484.1 DUF4190 domain-containing protein [Winogradskyella sp.]
MEQQKLPNATTSIVLSSISFICCCFSAGLGGILLSGIGFFLAKKDEKTYLEQPELYTNYSQVKTAKTLALIGIALGVLTFIWTAYNIWSIGGWDAYMEQVTEMMEQMQNQ